MATLKINTKMQYLGIFPVVIYGGEIGCHAASFQEDLRNSIDKMLVENRSYPEELISSGLILSSSLFVCWPCNRMSTIKAYAKRIKVKRLIQLLGCVKKTSADKQRQNSCPRLDRSSVADQIILGKNLEQPPKV
jgi:hypothetical protein